MSQTTPPTVTALPAAPSTSNPSTFASLADAFIAALSTFGTQLSALATNVYNNAVDAYNNAVSAAASAASAVSASGVTMWVSGTFADGDARWSPTSYLTYRKKGAGAGTTDPAADPANWICITIPPSWQTKTGSYTAVANDYLSCDTSGGAFNVTLPASPATNDCVGICDIKRNFATAAVTVLRNGNTIGGLSENMTCNTTGEMTYLIYNGSTWEVY